MTRERTLTLIKPNAVAAGHVGEILTTFEGAGLGLVALELVRLDRARAEAFYAEHAGKPFFERLVAFMTSGPIVALVLEGEGAIARNRELLGATDPAAAAPGTIRARFGETMTVNAVHGSDSPTSAAREIAFFFSGV